MHHSKGRIRILTELDRYICSFSGVRKRFAPSDQSRRGHISAVDRVIVGLFVHAFTMLLRNPAVVALATDSRPTGEVIAKTVYDTLRMHGFECRHLGVVPTPQLSAYCARNSGVQGGVCVTASHNPIGYNGLKFANANGALLDPQQFAHLSACFDALCADEGVVRRYCRVFARSSGRRGGGTGGVAVDRYASRRSRRDYGAVVREAIPPPAAGFAAASAAATAPTAAVAPTAAATPTASAIATTPPASATTAPCFVVVDYNGSARARSIDGELCAEYGATFVAYGARVGRIRRQIEPEGEALRYLRRRVARLQHANRRRSIARRSVAPAGDSYIGYMPDNDGDRGNIVYYDHAVSRVRSVSPQQLFALMALIRLSAPRVAGNDSPIIVANGPTSHCVDDIAVQYHARVHRAEVGEANVVGATRNAVAAGQRVVLSGEGSNGGCIITPSQVRDPLITVLHIVGLARSEMRSGHGGGIAALIDSLPRYRTTAVTDKMAALPLSHLISAEARRAYLLAVMQEILARRRLFTEHNIAHFAIYHYRHTEGHCYLRSEIAEYSQQAHEGHCVRISTDADVLRAFDGGGMKCLFYDRKMRFVASVWWRASATERKLRLIVDAAPAHSRVYDALLPWHRGVLERSLRR